MVQDFYSKVKAQPKLIGAGLGMRILAFIVDPFVVLAITLGLMLIFGKSPVVALFVFLFLWAYFAILESSDGQATLGKHICGLMVTDLQGNKISLARATGRHFSRKICYCALAGIGTFAVPFTRRKQALHDWATETLVVKKRARPQSESS